MDVPLYFWLQTDWGINDTGLVALTAYHDHPFVLTRMSLFS